MPKIFGREPAAFVGVLESVLPLLVAIGVIHWSNEQVGAVVAVVVAVLAIYTAFYTHDTQLAVLIGGAKAIFVLLVAFGFELSPETTAGIIAVITAVFAFYQRTQTSPLAVGSFKSLSAGAQDFG